jgi:YHS domain-containing protein
MHHPIHVHGAGRYGAAEPNLVWKDAVLVRTGETVDILLDVTDVGLWMAHCHIAEHHESGMMFSFQVDNQPDRAAGRLLCEGTAYFFCTLTCAGEFARQPEQFIA